MIWPLIALGWVINLYQRGMASMVRLHEGWSVAPDVLRDEGTAVDEAPHGDIDIRDLTFAYGVAAPASGAGPAAESGRRHTLRNINLQVRSGETVGIVGRTGSGKSTLLALITRTFEPPPGTIFIDGRPIESIPLRQLREWIGMVPQETFLFSESIAENIRFGRDTADADETSASADL